MANGKVVITAENRTNAGIQGAIRELSGLDEATKKIGASIKNAFTVLAIIDATKKIAEFGAECVKSYGEVERTMIQLKTAVGGNESSFRMLTSLIDDLGGKTLASKDEIEKMVAELASLGKSDTDIKRISDAALAMSNVTGKSLNEAMTMLNNSLNGTTKGIDKLLPGVKDLTVEQLKAGGAIEYVQKQFGAISDSMAGGVSQSLSNLTKKYDDLREALGQNLAPSFTPMIDWIGRIVNRWTDAINEQNRYQDALKTNGALADALFEKQQLQSKIAATNARIKTENANGPTPIADALLQKLMYELTAVNMKIQSFAPVNDGSGRTTGESGSSNSKLSAADSKVGTVEEFSKIMEDYGNHSIELFKTIKDISNVPNFVESYDAPGYTGNQSSSAAFDNTASEAEYNRQKTHAAFTSSQGGSGLADLATAIGPALQPLMSAFAPLTDIILSSNPAFAALKPIIEGFTEVVGPAVNTIIAPLMNALKGMGQLLGQALLPILDAISPVFSTISQILMTVFIPLLNLLMPAISIISGILSLGLTPVLKALASGMEILMAPVKWLGDLFKWVGDSMSTFVHNLTKPIWEANQAYSAFSSDAFTGLADRVAKIWTTDYSTNMAGGTQLSTSNMGNTGVSASYSGGNNTYNLNIYAPVCGDNGLQELFGKFKDFISDSGYYNHH